MCKGTESGKSTVCLGSPDQNLSIENLESVCPSVCLSLSLLRCRRGAERGSSVCVYVVVAGGEGGG